MTTQEGAYGELALHKAADDLLDRADNLFDVVFGCALGLDIIARPLLPPKKRRPSQLRFAEEFFLLMLLPPYLLTLTRGSTRP